MADRSGFGRGSYLLLEFGQFQFQQFHPVHQIGQRIWGQWGSGVWDACG